MRSKSQLDFKMTSRSYVKLERSFVHVPRTTPFTGKTLGQSFNETADNNPYKEMYVFYADKERKTYREVQNEVGDIISIMIMIN